MAPRWGRSVSFAQQDSPLEEKAGRALQELAEARERIEELRAEGKEMRCARMMDVSY